MKTPSLKNKTKSIRSRAAKRELSPSLEVDKSLTSLPRAERTVAAIPSVLAAQHNAGVSKKKKKQQTRAQRLRQEKGLERAEKILDIRENKVQRSEKRGKTVKARSAAWEDLNGSKREVTNPLSISNQNVDSMDTSDIEGGPNPPAPKQSKQPAAVLPPAEDKQYEFELDGEIT